MKIITDSSANILPSVPLRIVTDEKEYMDDKTLDTAAMVQELKAYKGKSSTACPNMNDWLNAFENEEEIYALTLTSNLSGCYSYAASAASEYMENHEGARVHVMDSLSTGPELALLAEKATELANEGKSFDEVVNAMDEYKKHTSLAFILGSLDNFAKNGRVNPALAKISGVLGIKIVGRASKVGDLEPLSKSKGEGRAAKQLFSNMKAEGYRGGRVRLTHTLNPALADKFFGMIKKEYPDADITISENRGICSFYAEEGSLLVGYEKN
ncbi:MAG: DegV family protein [Lachnospiraceae bacterium]|nr:DegV family protein [Lachnospiraceae bacterium]